MERQTKQRNEILKFLQSVTSHPTAEKIYQEVSKKIKNISLGTIYRNLENLKEEGEIIRLEINGEYHFDACIKSHQHLICKECGKIIDVFDDKIEKKIIKKIDEKEFIPEKTFIYVQGLCKKCYEQNNKSTTSTKSKMKI